jgi:hypothetical protein
VPLELNKLYLNDGFRVSASSSAYRLQRLKVGQLQHLGVINLIKLAVNEGKYMRTLLELHHRRVRVDAFPLRTARVADSLCTSAQTNEIRHSRSSLRRSSSVRPLDCGQPSAHAVYDLRCCVWSAVQCQPSQQQQQQQQQQRKGILRLQVNGAIHSSPHSLIASHSVFVTFSSPATRRGDPIESL